MSDGVPGILRGARASLFAVAIAAPAPLKQSSPPSQKPSPPRAAVPGFTPDVASLDFLRTMARDVVTASRVAPPESKVGFALVTPCGRRGYPAFWIRDFSMSLDCGLIESDEIEAHLKLVARCQNGDTTRPLANGLSVPPFAIPDHVDFDGRGVFFPGTYSSGDDQGSGAYGRLPPFDDDYEFIHIAHALWRARDAGSRSTKADAPSASAPIEWLREPIEGRPLLECLRLAFAVPTFDPSSGAVVTDEARRAVGFGFCDGIVLTGSLLFATLLRERAAQELADLCEAAGDSVHAVELRAAAATIRDHVAATFADPTPGSGWLLAATGIGRQPDVWGTLFALESAAIAGEPAARARAAVVAAVRRGTITLEAAVRHVPTDRDARADSAWERTSGVAHGTYQNGAYWHTPTGWLIDVVQQDDGELAAQLFQEYVDHLKRGDFRISPQNGAPWECFGQGGRGAQNGAYLTSIALPLSVLERLAKHTER